MASSSFFILIFVTLFATGYGLHCYVCNSRDQEACQDPFDEEAAKSSNLWKNCDVPAEADPIDPNEPNLQNRRHSRTHYMSHETGNMTRIKYSFCRKTVQKTALVGMKDEETRIIRTCGFIPDPKLVPEEGDDEEAKAKLRCFRRVGTFEVEMFYCACYGDSCNPSGRPEPGAFATLGSILLGMIIATRVVV